jgi:hypothetical protein
VKKTLMFEGENEAPDQNTAELEVKLGTLFNPNI